MITISNAIYIGITIFVVGVWVGAMLGAYKFTSTADEPYGVSHLGKVYDVTRRKLG